MHQSAFLPAEHDAWDDSTLCNGCYVQLESALAFIFVWQWRGEITHYIFNFMRAHRLHVWLHGDLAALCPYRCLWKRTKGSTKFRTKLLKTISLWFCKKKSQQSIKYVHRSVLCKACNGLKLHQWKYGLGVRKCHLQERIMKHPNSLGNVQDLHRWTFLRPFEKGIHQKWDKYV